MSAKGVAAIPQCEECKRLWLPPAGEWAAYRLDVVEDDPEDRLAFYCPECAEREFGEAGPSVD